MDTNLETKFTDANTGETIKVVSGVLLDYKVTEGVFIQETFEAGNVVIVCYKIKHRCNDMISLQGKVTRLYEIRNEI